MPQATPGDPMAGTDQSHLVAAFFLLVAVLYPPVALLRHRSDRVRARALARFARRVQLPVPEALRPRVADQLAAYHLGADLGGAAALALVSAWGLALGRGVAGSSWWPLVVIGAVLVGCAVGAGAAALRQAARPRSDGGPRVARPVAPALGDYVAPVELQGGRVAALLPTLIVLALASSAVTGAASPPLALPAGLATLGLLALAFGEVGARRVLDAPQAAGSDLELAWSDAIRAHTLRAVVTVPLAVGSYAAVGMLSTVSLDGVLDPRSIAGVALAALLGVAVIASVVAVAWTASGQPHRHFRRRLWPAGDPGHATSGARP
jgi:hypothetical protein